MSAPVSTGDISAGRDVIVGLGDRYRPSKYAGKVEAFYEEYLFSESALGQVPFGGRDDEFRSLNDWLVDPSGEPRCLIAAPAGRGKSALVVRWVRSFASTGSGCDPQAWAVAFVPVSIRYDTHRPEVFYELLAATLADILKETLRPSYTESAVFYADQCRELLNRAQERGVRILVILDGVDEAVGDRFSTDWFPRSNSGTLKLLVTARLQLGDQDGIGWVHRLRWDSGVRVKLLALNPLSNNGIADLLIRTGAPLDVLAARPDIVAKLQVLSAGEPLLLRLYAEDLWGRGSAAARLTIEDLEAIKPGFGGYFDHWLREQTQIWADSHQAPPLEEFEQFLKIFACARGRLRGPDLLALFEIASGQVLQGRLVRSLGPLKRFLVGQDDRDALEGGYIFSHPKFAIFLQEEHFQDYELDSTRAAFVEWGDRTLEALAKGDTPPEDAPRYLLQYYTDHLAEHPPGLGRLLGLASDGWLRAWTAFEGGYRGFSRDIARAVRGLSSLPTSEMRDIGIIRCRLILVSINSMGTSIPKELLVNGTKAGILSANQIRHWLEFKTPADRASVVSQLASRLPPEAVEEAIGEARQIGDRDLRLMSLARLVVAGTPSAGGALQDIESGIGSLTYTDSLVGIAESLSALPKVPSWLWDRGQNALPLYKAARILAALASHMSPGRLEEAVARIVANGSAGDALERAKICEALAPVATGTARLDLIALALALPASAAKAEALKHLLGAEVGDQRAILEDAIVTTVRDCSGLYEKTYAITTLLSVRKAESDAITSDFLALISACSGSYSFPDLLAQLRPHCDEKLLDQIVSLIFQLGDNDDKAAALSGLAPSLNARQLDEAAGLALEIDLDTRRERTLIALAPYLSPQRTAEVLTAMMSPGDQIAQILVCISFAANGPSEQRISFLRNALRVAGNVRDPRKRLQALRYLQPHVSAELAIDVQKIVAAIRHPDSYVKAAIMFSKYLNARSIDVALGLIDERASLFENLAPIVPILEDRHRGQVFDIVRRLKEGESKAVLPALEERFGSLASECVPDLDRGVGPKGTRRLDVPIRAMNVSNASAEELFFFSDEAVKGELAARQRAARELAKGKEIGSRGWRDENLEKVSPMDVKDGDYSDLEQLEYDELMWLKEHENNVYLQLPSKLYSHADEGTTKERKFVRSKFLLARERYRISMVRAAAENRIGDLKNRITMLERNLDLRLKTVCSVAEKSLTFSNRESIMYSIHSLVPNLTETARSELKDAVEDVTRWFP